MQLEVIARRSAASSGRPPLLFVHGAWHAAWCWDVNFLPFFAEAGYDAYALSLRGHGRSEGRDRLRWARIGDYVADVRQVAESIGPSPIVIGHSMGGLVVQKYLEVAPAPAAALLAPVPIGGALGATLRTLRRHPILFLKANLTMSLFPIVSSPALAEEAFFSATLPRATLSEYASRLQDESYLGYLDMVAFALPRPKSVQTPVAVFGAENDTIFSVSEIRATARAYGTEARIFPGMAHDMMLESDWRTVAESLLGWFGRFSKS